MRSIITKAIALLITLNIATLAQEKGSFTDTRDKKKYKTVKIGEQVWLAENLNYADKDSKCYGEGGKVESIGGRMKDAPLSKAQIQANCTKYGRLYNFETAAKACPAGWYLPFKSEWEKLFLFADSTYAPGKFSNEGKYLKAKSGWDKQYDGKSGNGTDKFGFFALPGGYAIDSLYYGVGNHGEWWSGSATAHALVEREDGSRSGTVRGVNNVFYSVRCIQGNGEEAAKAEADAKAAKEKAEAEAKAAKEKAEAAAKAEGEAYAKANGGTFTDTRDKKTYKTIKINGQVWLAENLNYAAENSKCYDDKPENCTKYGKLYNWETATKSCPAGWHLPKNEEWDKLYRSADGTNGTESPYQSKTAGKFLKSANGWADIDKKGTSGNGTDKFGFSALPSGYFTGKFSSIGYDGYWWSSTSNNDKAYWTNIPSTRMMGDKRFDYTVFQEVEKKTNYLSVRCIKD